MRGEQLSDAIVYDKLHILKKDFDGYIERHTVKVDANLPVFFGYVVSALDRSFPRLADEAYDDFIDSITFKLLDASKNLGDSGYIKRVTANALRFKKRKDAGQGTNIVIGLRLLKAGDPLHALEYLKDYATLDTKMGMAVAYCYYVLSLREFRESDKAGRSLRPGEMELLARELILTLARTRPPVNKLKQLHLDDPSFLEKAFWQMVFTGLEWFPNERWFIEAGLTNAALTGDAAMRKRMLDIGAERFYNEIRFLREMYYYDLENNDLAGAAGVVNQMLKQYPDNREPVFLGLKLSLLTTKKITYSGFRRLAISKGLPAQVLELFDFSFDLLNNEYKEALARLADFEKEYPGFRYYATLLRYLVGEFQSDDEARVKKARKALLDSLDQYSAVELGIAI